jgi:hypothetical protein
LGLIQAFKHYKEDWAKNSVWLFVVFYGYTMYRPEIMDSSRYVTNLEDLYATPVSWNSFISNFYSEDSGTVDIYQPLVTYILSLFTKSGNILFAVFGITFGYFYSRNIWLLIDLTKKRKMDSIMWLLLIAFACVIGFWDLNGVRMWTAAHIFFYGAFLLLVHEKKKGLLIAALSVLVHFSFVLPVGVLLLFYAVKIPWRVLYFFFLASFFISTLNIDVVRNKLETIVPEFLVPRVQSYTSDEYIEVVTENTAVSNWYINYYYVLIGWFLLFLFTIIYFSKRNLKSYSNSFYNLFGFSLLLLSVGNITSLLPSGGRYSLIAQLFGMALVYLFYIINDDTVFKRRLLLFSPILILFIVISVRISFDTITFMTILTNPLLALIIDMPIPLINGIK